MPDHAGLTATAAARAGWLRETAWRPPASAFAALHRHAPEGLAFLDSAGPVADPRGRWSTLALAPFETMVAAGPADAAPVLDEVAARMRAHRRPPVADADAPPFTGGAIGLIGYEAGLAWHGIASRHAASALPALSIGLYDQVIAFDRLHRRCWIAAPDAATAHRLERRLAAAPDLPPTPEPGAALAWRAVTTPERHRAAVAAIVAAIGEGALFQANYTAGHVAPRPPGLDVAALYLRLRARTASPFSAWLDLGGATLLCASPERFLHLDAAGRVETRPIKGTAPRAVDPTEDLRHAARLAADPKERAENLMIVDLMRNDLARVCRIGSVRVPHLCAVERFATVHHLVSGITARLRPDCDAFDLLRACLPGGSVTGAPKHAAMQWIDRLEDRPRGAYCGTVLRIGQDGAMDSNIVIRSLVVDADTVRTDAGGGITAGSDPQAEYREAQLKLAALVAP